MERQLPDPESTAIRDLARQQELQFNAINSRIASLASESGRQQDLSSHPVVTTLLTEFQTVKTQLQAFLTAYSSKESDASHMTPQRVSPEDDDSARVLNTQSDTRRQCSANACLDLALDASTFCTIHAVPTDAFDMQRAPQTDTSQARGHTTHTDHVSEGSGESVSVLESKPNDPKPDPILITDETESPAFADFAPAMTLTRCMASHPPSRPVPRQPDQAEEARARMLDMCATLKAYCLSHTPTATPDRRPEGTYPPAASHGPPWTLARDQTNWMPDYAKWRALTPTYNARHYKEPELPYTDACLIQLNDFNLPENISVPQRRKFHRMALARCVSMVYGLDFMTVSCAVARHVMDTYELIELQAPITPIKFLLEPVPDVLAFFEAVTQAEPLPTYAQDSHPYVTMHDRDQAKEHSKLRLATARPQSDSLRTPQSCYKCGRQGHFASTCQSSMGQCASCRR